MAELAHGIVIPSALQHEAEGDGSKATTVLVTGFGPFLDKYPVNSSWSIASTLPSVIPATKLHPDPIRILVHPWPVKVAYQAALDLVPQVFEPTYPKPDLILHIGLAAGRDHYTMEHGSHRKVYFRNRDVDGKTFSEDQSDKRWGDLPDRLTTGFDTEDLYKRWRTELVDQSIDIRPSEDAGNYLCGFIYFTTMSKFAQAHAKERPVMFLHVPNLPNPEDIAQGREVAKALIRAMVDSHREKGTYHGN